TAIFRRSLTCMASWLSGALGSRCSRLPRVHGLQPAAGIGRLAADDLEERLLDSLGHRAAPAAADLDPVDGADWGDFDGRSDEEHFVSHVKHLARQGLLTDLEAELARNRDDRVSRDARQHRVANRRRVDDVLAD